MSSTRPLRGEVWDVRFDPSEGDEIKKVRPAVVMSISTVGRMAAFLQSLCVDGAPPTNQPKRTLKGVGSGLFSSQVSFYNMLSTAVGVVTPDQVEEMAAAVALCIGYQP